MNIYVLHPATKNFLTSNGAWTTRQSDAMRFKTSRDAIVYCSARTHDVDEVILEYAESDKPIDSRIKLRTDNGAIPPGFSHARHSRVDATDDILR